MYSSGVIPANLAGPVPQTFTGNQETKTVTNSVFDNNSLVKTAEEDNNTASSPKNILLGIGAVAGAVVLGVAAKKGGVLKGITEGFKKNGTKGIKNLLPNLKNAITGGAKALGKGFKGIGKSIADSPIGEKAKEAFGKLKPNKAKV